MSRAEEHPVSRTPSDYTPSLHFAQRFKGFHDDHPRHLDGEIVNQTIQNGQVQKDKKDVYFLRETFSGVTYRIVVNIELMEVITGYPIGLNEKVAGKSGRWTAQEIRDVKNHISEQDRKRTNR